MKKTILLAATIFTVAAAHAQTDFKPVLQATYIAFDTSHDLAAKTEQANKLGLIAKKWPDEWATNYYAAYSKTMLSFLEQDGTKKDAYLDEAQSYEENAKRLIGKPTDETYVMDAMIANARISVDGRARYQKYGKIFSDNLDSAKALNPDNPRIYYLRGTSKFYTPKMFGGGKKAALPYFEKADGLFEKQSTDDILKPSWGKGANDYFIGLAKGEDKEDK